MRIRGYFGHFGAPCVAVKLKRNDSDKVLVVPFIIDTGAYWSMVGTKIIYDLGVSIHELRKSVGTAVGFGGRSQFYFLKDVELTLETDQGPHAEALPQIMTPFGPYTGVHRKRAHVKSILGRDILDRYALILDKRSGLVILTDDELTGPRPLAEVGEAQGVEEA
jgi:hypothetical protein